MEEDKSKEKKSSDPRAKQLEIDFLQSGIDANKRKQKDKKSSLSPTHLQLMKEVNARRKKDEATKRKEEAEAKRLKKQEEIERKKNIAIRKSVYKEEMKSLEREAKAHRQKELDEVKRKKQEEIERKKNLAIKKSIYKEEIKSLEREAKSRKKLEDEEFAKLLREEENEKKRIKQEQKEWNERKKRNIQLQADKKAKEEREFQALLDEEKARTKREDDYAKEHLKNAKAQQGSNFHNNLLGIKGAGLKKSDFMTMLQADAQNLKQSKIIQGSNFHNNLLGIKTAGLKASDFMTMRQAQAQANAQIPIAPTATTTSSSTVKPSPKVTAGWGNTFQAFLNALRKNTASQNTANNMASRAAMNLKRRNAKQRYQSVYQGFKVGYKPTTPKHRRNAMTNLSDSLFKTSFMGMGLGNPLNMLMGAGLGATGITSGLMGGLGALMGFGGNQPQKGLMTKRMLKQERLKAFGKHAMKGGMGMAKGGVGLTRFFAGRGALGLLSKLPVIGPILSMGLAGGALVSGVASSISDGDGIYEGLKRGGSMALSLATFGLLSPDDIRGGASAIQDAVEKNLLGGVKGGSFEAKAFNGVATVLANITSGILSIMGWADAAKKLADIGQSFKLNGVYETIFGKPKDYATMTDKQLIAEQQSTGFGASINNELLRRGLVKKQKHGRSTNISLTDKGKSLIEQKSPVVDNLDDMKDAGLVQKYKTDGMTPALRKRMIDAGLIEVKRGRWKWTEEGSDIKRSLTTEQQARIEQTTTTKGENLASFNTAVTATGGDTNIINNHTTFMNRDGYDSWRAKNYLGLPSKYNV